MVDRQVLTMKLITKATITYGALLAMAAAGAGAAVWTSNQARFHIDRMELANRSYQAHLRLSNDTYQLFKEFGDSLVLGQNDGSAKQTRLIAGIRTNIAEIRSIIGAEIQLVGSEEVEELQLLADLERRLDTLVARYEAGVVRNANSADLARMREIASAIDAEIDGEFNSMIQAALLEELEEVEETKAEARKLMSTYTLISILLGFVSLIVGVLAILLINRDLNRPVRLLEQGAKEIAAGNWNHKVPTDLPNELASVSEALNEAAVRAGARERSAKAARDELEGLVNERTADLQLALDRLNREVEMRRQLLADVSHELRTPLTIIRGETGVALRGGEKSAGEYREALIKAKEAAEHTASLVDDLLFVAREESGESRLDLQDNDLSEAVQSATDHFSNIYSEDGFELEFVSELDEAPARFDDKRIHQVLLVLLENAHLYGASPVTVGLNRTKSGYEIFVKDNGDGIPADEVEDVFSRFFRGSNASERYGAGSGLGLPVARSIVEAHGGALTYEGTEGSGARFVVSLPFRAPVRAVA